MKIDLNDHQYKDKLDVSDSNILLYLDEYNIYKNYIGDFVIGTTFKSPLKEKDDKHSFGIYWSKKYKGRLFFSDLAMGCSGDAFRFVSRLYNLSYFDTLLRIIYDFRLVELFKVPRDRVVTAQRTKPILVDKNKIPKHSDVMLNIRVRNWAEHDLYYWSQYGITLDILTKYRIVPIDYIFLNDQIIKAEIYSYAYIEEKDGILRYKIYQPLSKKMKWLSNFIDGTISGWAQMPESGRNLVITSSSKDMMCLVGLGYNSIAPQTETYSFKPQIVDILQSRFTNIYIFYDYDEAGIKNAYKNKELFGFNPIFTKSIKAKDPSDFYKRYGRKNISEKMGKASN